MRCALDLAGIVTVALALAGPAHAAGNAIELRGTGAQVYTCEASPSGFGWRLKAPEATLLDDAGAKAGWHFAGPTWQAARWQHGRRRGDGLQSRATTELDPLAVAAG